MNQPCSQPRLGSCCRGVAGRDRAIASRARSEISSSPEHQEPTALPDTLVTQHDHDVGYRIPLDGMAPTMAKAGRVLPGETSGACWAPCMLRRLAARRCFRARPAGAARCPPSGAGIAQGGITVLSTGLDHQLRPDLRPVHPPAIASSCGSTEDPTHSCVPTVTTAGHRAGSWAIRALPGYAAAIQMEAWTS